MTTVTTCDNCGEREPTGFQRNGKCRECRGLTTTTRNHRVYVSPDRAERDGDVLAYREQESRSRVVDNRVNAE